MKMANDLTRYLAMAFLGLAVTFTACQKENSTVSTDEDAVFANESAAADVASEVVFDDVFDNVMGVNAEVGVGEVGVFGRFNNPTGAIKGEAGELESGRTDSIRPTPCYTVTINRLNAPNPFPVKVTVDFGTGCVGLDGRTRKGKIITVYTGRLTQPGSVAETSFDGYYVNGIKVEGTHRVENQSTSNVWVFKVNVQNAKLTHPNGNFSQWNRAKIITQIEGLGTPLFPRDDVFSIRGEASGTVKRDSLYFQWGTRTIEPLIKKFSCPWIVKGKLAIRKSNTDAAVLDYGNGDCDNKATLTRNGITTQIILH